MSLIAIQMTPQNIYDRYHAHVYFDQQTVERAADICRMAGEQFEVEVGRVHRKPVGPHPCWSCQLAFEAAEFDQLIPWLDAQRGSLNVLVHGLTGDDLADHTDHASWLGAAQALKLSIFQPREIA
ncbi:DOPA 4,5-dioxygenase family protein [filamentous cyanobacterium LEGE 11480]|uniref:DOPA 4,5-dioxygenase family protein n=2 Tax=Romeriopsis TaxID=2992131 RepID=A0A928VIR4_9CYAN|nr:DOPA 4,5-dioxygenase family protein [Romeriopsis navalis LEGE 11480]